MTAYQRHWPCKKQNGCPEEEPTLPTPSCHLKARPRPTLPCSGGGLPLAMNQVLLPPTPTFALAPHLSAPVLPLPQMHCAGGSSQFCLLCFMLLIPVELLTSDHGCSRIFGIATLRGRILLVLLGRPICPLLASAGTEANPDGSFLPIAWNKQELFVFTCFLLFKKMQLRGPRSFPNNVETPLLFCPQ